MSSPPVSTRPKRATKPSLKIRENKQQEADLELPTISISTSTTRRGPSLKRPLTASLTTNLTLEREAKRSKTSHMAPATPKVALSTTGKRSQADAPSCNISEPGRASKRTRTSDMEEAPLKQPSSHRSTCPTSASSPTQRSSVKPTLKLTYAGEAPSTPHGASSSPARSPKKRPTFKTGGASNKRKRPPSPSPKPTDTLSMPPPSVPSAFFTEEISTADTPAEPRGPWRPAGEYDEAAPTQSLIQAANLHVFERLPKAADTVDRASSEQSTGQHAPRRARKRLNVYPSTGERACLFERGPHRKNSFLAAHLHRHVRSPTRTSVLAFWEERDRRWRRKPGAVEEPAKLRRFQSRVTGFNEEDGSWDRPLQETTARYGLEMRAFTMWLWRESGGGASVDVGDVR